MSRLRFIADNPRGNHGGHNDHRQIFGAPDSAKRHCNKGDKRVGTLPGRVLVLDLDELEVANWSVDERWQFHERQMQRHAQLAMELKPEAALAETPDGDRVLLSADDVRHLSLVASRWLQARGETYNEKERARRDLENLLVVLFRDGKLKKDTPGSLFYGPLDGAKR